MFPGQKTKPANDNRILRDIRFEVIYEPLSEEDVEHAVKAALEHLYDGSNVKAPKP